MSTYLFNNSHLIIKDENINFSYEEEFNPILIPENLKNGLKVTEDHTLKVFRFSDGSFEYSIQKDGLFDGEYLLSYPNGKTKLHCYYKSNQLHGPSIFYSPSEKPLVESWFLMGKKTGRLSSFYQSGSKFSLQLFLNNVWHGKQLFWYEDGTLKTSMDYENGEVHGKVILFYPNGDLKRELVFNKGICIEL